MTQSNPRERSAARLAGVLEIYGADRTRWPAADRLELAAYISNDAEAKRALDEAAALDRVLDLAPTVAVERERALAGRIVAVAMADPHARHSPAMPQRLMPLSDVSRQKWRQSPAAALLAASMILGLLVGTSAPVSRAYDTLAAASGMADEEAEVAVASELTISEDEQL